MAGRAVTRQEFPGIPWMRVAVAMRPTVAPRRRMSTRLPFIRTNPPAQGFHRRRTGLRFCRRPPRLRGFDQRRVQPVTNRVHVPVTPVSEVKHVRLDNVETIGEPERAEVDAVPDQSPVDVSAVPGCPSSDSVAGLVGRSVYSPHSMSKISARASAST